MIDHPKTRRWLRFLPPVVLIVITATVFFWKTEPRFTASLISYWSTQDSATATQSTGECKDTCSEPCCAGEKREAPENASCLSLPVTNQEAKGMVWTQALVQEFKTKGDWCAPHGVPHSMCVRCNPALIDTFKAKGDWCEGHNLPESLCTVCHKDLIPLGIGRDWCEEHGLPESQCTLCNPKQVGQLSPDNLPGQASLVTVSLDAEVAEQEFKTALGSNKEQRKGINPDCPLHHMKIHLASQDVAREAGLHIEPAGTRYVSESLQCYGDIQYDRAHYAALSSRAPGIVHSVGVNLGDKVSKGDVLATIESTDFGKAKAAFLRARTEADRAKWLNDSLADGNTAGAVSRKEIIESKAGLEAAGVELAITRQALLNYGMTEEEIDHTAESRDTSALLLLRAPFNATVVDLNAVVGELTGPESKLAGVADLATMVACLDLHAEDLARVGLGMPVSFQVDRLRGDNFSGQITWISSSLDPQTRTGKVYAGLDNRDGLLRAGLFGQGTVTIHADEKVLSVPAGAVQWDGCCNLVFVQQPDNSFIPRKIRLGYESDGYSTVLAGLLPGERVVTQGSYLMKTEILKGSIGSGCCAEDSQPADGGTATGHSAR